MKMYTCLQIHNDYLIAGGETKSAILIANALERNGFRVIRYYRSNSELQNGVIQKLSSGLQAIYSKKTFQEIEEILLENTIDFALVHNTSPLISNSVYDVLKRHGIPVIKYLQNYNLFCLNGAMDQGDTCLECQKHPSIGVRKRCYRGSGIYSLLKLKMKSDLDRYYLSDIRGFVAISDFVRRKHISCGLPEGKIHTIYHFIDDSQGLSDSYSTEKPAYAVYMGRLSNEKGLFTLMQAFQKMPHIPLKIMGSGGLEAELRQFAEEHKMQNVEFMGFCDGEKKKQLLDNAKLMVVPSEWDEPFGRIVIEAYQHGTPVVASNRGGLPELIQPGVTGFTFQSGSHTDLIRSVTDLWNTPDETYLTMRSACVAAVSNLFSEKTYIKNFCSMIQSILDE